MAPKKCEHHDSPVNSSVSVSWTVKLFDYPGAVKVWLYQVVSIIYKIHSNSLFCIGSLMELGIKFPNHMIVEVLVYSSGLSCEKMCSTLQYHLRMMQRSTKSVWILATIRRWAMNFIWSPNWMSICPLFYLGFVAWSYLTSNEKYVLVSREHQAPIKNSTAQLRLLVRFAYSLPSFAEHPRSFASLFNQAL